MWGDLGVEPLALRRAKSKVVWYSKLLGKDKNSYCRQVFDKELNYEVEGGSSGKMCNGYEVNSFLLGF